MHKYLVLADGNSVHTSKWIRELSKYFEIYIISFNFISDDIIAIVGKENSFYLPSKVNISGGNINILCHTLKVARLIKQINPQYINAHYITSYGTMAVLATMLCGYSGKLISSTWGTDVLVTPWKNKIYFYLTRLVLSKSDIVTSDSRYMTTKILGIYARANVMTFPFGIEEFPKVAFKEKNFQYLFSNRGLEQNYNIDLAIRIFAKLYSLGKVEKLYIAHDGTERKNLQHLVQKLKLTDVVKFLGFMSLDQQRKYYKECGFYISVPTSDSTSVSLLEAMAYGCVPIVSNIPANREWIANKENGLVVDNLEGVDISGLDYENIFNENKEKIKKQAIWSENIAKYINKIKNIYS